MQNVRHFWSSVRPNGPDRPHNVDRLELRICDFTSDIDLLLGITAFLELRVITLFNDLQNSDPLITSKFSLQELQEISDHNELEVAKDSLNAELINWKNGKTILCKTWIEYLLADLTSAAKAYKMSSFLKPIYKVIAEGNDSMKWIRKYQKGLSVENIMQSAINNMIKSEEQNNL